jgi:hypothetical protein
LSALGVLFTETGRVDAAVPYHLAALAGRVRLGSPDVGRDLRELRYLRRIMGDRFMALLGEHLDEDSARNLLQMLDASPDVDRDVPSPRTARRSRQRAQPERTELE